MKDKIIIHFIGISGIGMSGIAELMQDKGYQIQGSDIILNENVDLDRSNIVASPINEQNEMSSQKSLSIDLKLISNLSFKICLTILTLT